MRRTVLIFIGAMIVCLTAFAENGGDVEEDEGNYRKTSKLENALPTEMRLQEFLLNPFAQPVSDEEAVVYEYSE